MSDDLARRAAVELLVVAGFWLDAFDRDRRRLVDAAVAALVAGLDSPALRELAGLYGDEEWSTVDALVLATARELASPARAWRGPSGSSSCGGAGLCWPARCQSGR